MLQHINDHDTATHIHGMSFLIQCAWCIDCTAQIPPSLTPSLQPISPTSTLPSNMWWILLWSSIPAIQGSPLGYGHHLAFFHPHHPESTLCPDGADTDFCPPEPFTWYMWVPPTPCQHASNGFCDTGSTPQPKDTMNCPSSRGCAYLASQGNRWGVQQGVLAMVAVGLHRLMLYLEQWQDYPSQTFHSCTSHCWQCSSASWHSLSMVIIS